MQNVISIWNSLNLRRRIVLVGATAAVFLAVLFLARQMESAGQVLLYAGLDPRTAGEVITALDQRAVVYAVRGDSIFVAAEERDALRMSLAGEGLPAAGGAGYELLDTLSGFGTTAQMFDAAYWRAKEGELARTIRTIPGVRAVRVHIAQGATDPFRRDMQPTASVTLTMSNGGISDDQARALKHMIASAVARMRPSDVQVIDTTSGLVLAEDEAEEIRGGSAQDRAEAIRQSVERLLTARVGPGKAVVEVAVDLVTEREQITERRLDPDGRVAISSDTEERSEKNREPGGEVTVASNLPDGDAAAGATGQSESSEIRERVNFEVSETQRDLLRGPGGIKRLSLAVLIDGQVLPDANGLPVWQSRSADELSALRELVASAVGFDEKRGDSLTLKSMEFLPSPQAGSEAAAGLLPEFGPINTNSALQIAALTLVALTLAIFVLRPLLANRQTAALPSAMTPLALPAMTPREALDGEIDSGFSLPDLPIVDFSGAGTEVAEDPAARLRRMIGVRQAESIEILRGWLEPEEERA